MTVYRSTNQSDRREETEASAAREILAEHVPDRETACCVVCLTPGPCRPANAAANRLAELGRPVLPADEPERRRRGWLDRLGRHRAAYRPAPLLTVGWRLRLGLASPVRQPAGITG